PTYSVIEVDEGAHIRVVATVTDSNNQTTSAASGATAAVVDIALAVSAPVIGNTSPHEGDTLTVVSGGVANDSDAHVAFTWYDVANSLVALVPISTTYVQNAEDEHEHAGKVATVNDSSDPTTSAASAATAAVADITLEVSAPVISNTLPHEGDTLTVVSGGV